MITCSPGQRHGMGMAAVNSGGVDIHYDVYADGDRPWLVFAHGAGGNAACWWQQVPYFYRNYNLVTFDHRGFGRSRCSLEQFREAHDVADLEAILTVLGIERAALVCQSMGGWTGLRFALDNPHRVTALVMSHTYGGIRADAIADARDATAERGFPSEPFGHWALALDLPERNATLAHLYRTIGEFNVDFNAFGGVQAFLDLDLGVDPEELDGYDVPTLFVTADQDVVIPPVAIEAAHALTPGSELINLGDSGHSSYFEIPDVFNRAVARFLGRHETTV